MKNGRRNMTSRMQWTLTIILPLMLTWIGGSVQAANVVADSDMELVGTANWPDTNITGNNLTAKDTAWFVSPGQSLRTQSAQGNAISVGWYMAQTVGSIGVTDVVTLSLEYAHESSKSGGTPASGTFFFDIKASAAGTWTTVWSQAVSPTTLVAASLPGQDISSFFTSTTSYDVRLRFEGVTQGKNGARLTVYWDDVILDVVGGGNITTLSDGIDPAASPAVCPSPDGGAVDLDAFSLQTDGNEDAVTDLSVTLTPGGAADFVGLLEITNDAGDTVYGSVSDPVTDTVLISLANLNATASLVQYKVRVTPRAHVSMPPPPGSSPAIQGTVTSITTTANSTAGSDVNSDTVTVDNASTGAGSLDSCTGFSSTQIDLVWTNPADADFNEVILVRGPSSGACPVFGPVEGDTYIPGVQGVDEVVYSGGLTSFSDTLLAASTTYCYEMWARDDCGNWIASPPPTTSCSTLAAGNVTNLGDGTDPALNPAVCPAPGGGATELDAFTLQTDGNSDGVSSLTVALTPPGAAALLALVEVTDDTGSTVYGSTASPASDNVVIALSSLTADGSLTQYKVRVTPRTHADMAVPPGTALAIQGTVSAITPVSNAAGGSDVDSDTVTVDNASPEGGTFDTCTGFSSSQIDLVWTNPADSDFSQVAVIRGPATGACPSFSPVEGDTYGVGAQGADQIIYVGALASVSDLGLTGDTTYCYEIWGQDSCGNWSATPPDTVSCATGIVVADALTTAVPTVVVDNCTQITVSAGFSGDGNSSSTTTVKRGLSAVGPWTDVSCNGLTGASPRTCVDATARKNSSYYYEVTFADDDGVSGTNPQVVGPFVTPYCAPATTVTANSAVASSCQQITVTTTFSGDGNDDGTTLVESSLAGQEAFTTVCAALSGPSPRQCLVPGLESDTAYDIRITSSDPDSVSGLSPARVDGVTTLACGTDTEPPTQIVLAPARGAIIGGSERVKVQIFDADSALSALEWSVDGGVFTSYLGGINSNYDCGVGCAVYEFDLDTTGLANGAHTLTVRAIDSATPATNMAVLGWGFTVANQGGRPEGDGRLLRRTHSSQVCMDCHNLPTHSSQHTSRKYGNWAIDCLTCHTPHQTRNIYLIREDMRTPGSGNVSVQFQFDDAVGETNPGELPGDNPGRLSFLGDRSGTDNAPWNDGICETCHTKTKHYRNSAEGGKTHSQNIRCAKCHEHNVGFTGGDCDDCHNSPPLLGNHGAHDQVGQLPTSYENLSSSATAGGYGFACGKCHSGDHINDATHDGSAADPFAVEVSFDATQEPVNSSGSFTGVYNENTESGTSGEFWSWSDGSCSDLYCHSNAGPLNGTLQYQTPAPTWNQAGPLACTDCHDGAAAVTGLSAAHGTHLDPDAYNFGCERCHDATAASSSAIADKRLHVNGARDLDFDASGPDNSGGTYDDVAHSCSDTYCHSNGQNKVAPFSSGPSIAWDTSATCRSCHDGDATQAPTMATGRHASHVNNVAVIGTNYGCVECHSATVSDNSTILGFAQHVDGEADVVLSSGTYSAPNCNDSQCHSSGQEPGQEEFYAPDWTTDSLDCKGCHGRHSENAFTSVAGEPNYANSGAGTARANSHQVHVDAAIDCGSCHADTTATGTSILAASTTHTNGTADVVIIASRDGNGGTGADNYDDLTKTCSDVTCHAGVAKVWGDTAPIDCRTCHMQTGAGDQDVDDYVFSTSSAVAVVDGEDWGTYGHGAASAYVETGNAGADLDFGGRDGCLYCHDDTAIHNDPGNPFRLANVAGADGKNGACLSCHKDNGDSGYNPGSGLVNSSLNVGTAHYGTRHGVGLGGNGGAFCWDCHDPHGDYNYTDSRRLGYMMQREPVRDHSGLDGWGIPLDLAPVPDFRNDRDGTAGFSWGDFAIDTLDADAKYHGICQVCHTQNSRFQQADIDTYTFAQDATHFNTQGSCTVAGCHLHANNFKNKGCNECHFAPPDPGPGLDAHGIHYSTGVVPDTYDNSVPSTTADNYGFPCGKCHSATHLNDATHTGETAGDPFQVEVVFDSATAPANPSGTYAQLYPDATDQGFDGRFWSWTDDPTGPNGTCADLYCHSNAAPSGGGVNQSTDVVWGQTTSLDCTGCHSDTGRDDSGLTTDLSQNHGKHLDLTTYSFTCDECHSATVQDDSRTVVADRREHVDGGKDVAFSALAFSGDNVDQSAGSYAAGTCSDTYCHSQGTTTIAPFLAANADPDWNAGTTSCDSCHGGNAVAAFTMAEDTHTAHVDQAAYLGDNFMCSRCHQDTVSAGSDTAINDFNFHVNTTRDVNLADGGSYAAPGCTSVYCHSDGTETPGFATVPDWDSGTVLANDCTVCHGGEGGSLAGEPRYANNTGSFDTRNSHNVPDHVSSAGDCVKCHDGTVTAGGALEAGGDHLNASRDVANATFIASYDEASETCSALCHGGNATTWGDSLSCRNCHLTGTGISVDDDVDDYVWDNLFSDGVGTASKIDGDDWMAYGHGLSGSNYQESGNPPAAFDAAGDGCLYCHDGGVTHNNPANFFRLSNTGGADGKVGNCLVCHSTTATGFDPGSGNIDATTKIDANHYGSGHSDTADGGMFCWDCHDPHGDYNWEAGQPLAYMIQTEPVEDHSGSDGWGIPTQLALTPDFRADRDGTAAWGWADYAVDTAVGGSMRGVCQVCHDDASNFQKNLYTSGHNSSDPAKRCTDSGCHEHNQPLNDAFKPAGGGNCLACHGTGTQGTSPVRRAVQADFSLQSHHVGANDLFSQALMGGALTNYDCIVCHLEGSVDGGGEVVTDATYHGGDNGTKSIDLRHADTNDLLAYDKEAAGMPAAGSPGSWNSGNAAWRDQMENNLDPFCLSCHDSDGASHLTAAPNPGGGTALNPFNDTQITNQYDQLLRKPALLNPPWAGNPGSDGTGRVIDIASKVVAGTVDLDVDQARIDQDIWDPPEGIYSRHAIRGQSESVYVGTDPNLDTATYRNWTNYTWVSNSVMACADCHTTDGSNGAVGNAHGSTSEYLLKDEAGGAADPVFDKSANDRNYVCYQCHTESWYNEDTSHTGNSGDWQQYADQVGAARIPEGTTGGSIYGTTCGNCHGGYGFGTIHGTSQVLGAGQDGTGDCGRDPCDPDPRPAYRFTNGSSMRYYDAQGWSGSTSECYTLSAQDAPWGGCIKHNRGSGSRTKAIARPLAY